MGKVLKTRTEGAGAWAACFLASVVGAGGGFAGGANGLEELSLGGAGWPFRRLLAAAKLAFEGFFSLTVEGSGRVSPKAGRALGGAMRVES
jgi:hypothetical protein